MTAKYKEMTYGAVTESDGTSKLDEISSRDRRVLSHEGDEVVNRVIDTVVGREQRLNGREKEHRAVSSATATNRAFRRVFSTVEGLNSRRGTQALRNSNGVVYGNVF